MQPKHLAIIKVAIQLAQQRKRREIIKAAAPWFNPAYSSGGGEISRRSRLWNSIDADKDSPMSDMNDVRLSDRMQPGGYSYFQNPAWGQYANMGVGFAAPWLAGKAGIRIRPTMQLSDDVSPYDAGESAAQQGTVKERESASAGLAAEGIQRWALGDKGFNDAFLKDKYGPAWNKERTGQRWDPIMRGAGQLAGMFGSDNFLGAASKNPFTSLRNSFSNPEDNVYAMGMDEGEGNKGGAQDTSVPGAPPVLSPDKDKRSVG